MTRLSRANLPQAHLIGASAPQQTGIVHFGLGNFHRAHAAVNTALALAAEPGEWGILGIANRSRRVTTALQEQDFLYSVVTLDPAAEEVGVVDVHRRLLVAAEDGPDILAAAADPAHKIITLTISETGYHLDPRTGLLDLAAADVASDLASRAPASPLGQLAFGLMRRHAENGAPISVLSCDNLLAAGHTTRAAVTQFAQEAEASEDFLGWLGDSVSFPNAMVDRIVPAPTDETSATAARVLGVEDASPVPAEKFSQWVIEDDFRAGRPRWEAAGVIFTDEVEKYEQVKLRLLNGGHSLIAYLGGLYRRDTIPASRQQPFIEDCVRACLMQEYLPSIDQPTGFDADAYVQQLFARWSNTVLGDKTARVGSDGSTKLVQRVPIPAMAALDRGRMPHQLALTVAGWICCVCPPAGFDPGPVAAAMIEPKADALRAVAQGATNVASHARAIAEASLPDDLVAHGAFVERVADLAQIIVTGGVRAAAADALAARQ
ncbi:mannitol dehydrogenase family protein [Propioniciclava soli]|uniref:mannitol dehydrogenase family protein n=1 Tax=Propioniciclava soli TaxID=2775081 RepID=UPI001E38F32F|nr:mannitol dehydrogenase family protein [Propioniciclava soli]